jgi:hypothetical protein
LSWQDKARRAKALLATAKQGEREAVLRSQSGTQDVNTLRRSVFALSFVDGIESTNPVEHDVVLKAPLSVVEIFARWSAFDAPGALEAVRAWSRNPVSVRALAEAMRERRSKFGLSSAKSLEDGYRARMIGVAERIVSDLVGGQLTRPNVQFKDSYDPAIDYRFLSVKPDMKVESIAVLIVGPYRNPGLYRKKRTEWLLKAFGLAWVHDHVVLLLPDSSELPDYKSRIAATSRRAHRAGSHNEHAAKIGSAEAVVEPVRMPKVYAATPSTRSTRSRSESWRATRQSPPTDNK